MRPSISIITITLNSERHLEQTVSSVARQDYANIEYIVVDGGSTDKTLDILDRYKNTIDIIVSEKDSGIADAMNKGLGVATGDYILFLHSDDYLLAKDSIRKASLNICQDDDIFLLSIYLKNDCDQIYARPRGFSFLMNFKTGVWHQSAICSKRLFDAIGGFDTSIKVAMDYDFFLRAFRLGYKVKKVDFPLSVMRLSGISSRKDWDSLKSRFLEEENIHKKNCSGRFMSGIYALYWLFYPLYRKILYTITSKCNKPQS